MHVNIFFSLSILSVGVKAATQEVFVCLYPHSMHIISTFSEFSMMLHFFFFFLFLFFFFFFRFSISTCVPRDAERQSLSNNVKPQVNTLILSSHWLLWPRSLCDRLWLSNWVCVGPLQLSMPALPLRLRKQTVSLASTSAVVQLPLLNPPSSCFLWASTSALSCSCASSSSSATSSCCWPMADEQEEEDKVACPCFFLLSSLQVADIAVVAGVTLVCIHNTSLSLWPWTEGMMGIEQERNGGGGERLGRRPGLRRLRVAGSG